MKALEKRLDALEHQAGGTAVLVVVDPCETTEQAIARYEALHGPQPSAIWQPIHTGVPRGDSRLCA